MTAKKSFTKFTQKIGKRRLTVLISAAAVLLCVVGAFAAYTSVNSVKRVVSTKAGSGAMFSSNYLSENSAVLKSVPFSDDTEVSPTVTVDICNYAQTDPTRHNSEDIPYTVTAVLTDSDGKAYSADSFDGEWYSAYKISLNGKSYTFDKSLEIVFEDQVLVSNSAPNVSSVDSYKLTFDGSQLKNPEVFVKMTAEPGITKGGITTLSGIIGVSLKGAEGTVGWTGTFSDGFTSGSTKTTEYDGFNYEISGSGSGTVTLSWNTDYVDISPWFKESLTDGSLVSETDGSMTFKVNAAENNLYTLQFYRTRPADPSETWDAAKKSVAVGNNRYVTFKFESDEE